MLNMMQYEEGYPKIRYSWKETESKWEVCFGKRSFQENNKFKVSRRRGGQSERDTSIGNIVARGKKNERLNRWKERYSVKIRKKSRTVVHGGRTRSNRQKLNQGKLQLNERKNSFHHENNQAVNRFPGEVVLSPSSKVLKCQGVGG